MTKIELIKQWEKIKKRKAPYSVYSQCKADREQANGSNCEREIK